MIYDTLKGKNSYYLVKLILRFVRNTLDTLKYVGDLLCQKNILLAL